MTTYTLNDFNGVAHGGNGVQPPVGDTFILTGNDHIFSLYGGASGNAVFIKGNGWTVNDDMTANRIVDQGQGNTIDIATQGSSAQIWGFQNDVTGVIKIPAPSSGMFATYSDGHGGTEISVSYSPGHVTFVDVVGDKNLSPSSVHLI